MTVQCTYHGYCTGLWRKRARNFKSYDYLTLFQYPWFKQLYWKCTHSVLPSIVLDNLFASFQFLPSYPIPDFPSPPSHPIPDLPLLSSHPSLPITSLPSHAIPTFLSRIINENMKNNAVYIILILGEAVYFSLLLCTPHVRIGRRGSHIYV